MATTPTDVLRVVVLVGNDTARCDVSLGKASTILDEIERKIRRETTEMMGRKLTATELTDSMGRMAGVAAHVGDDAVLIVAAVWMAVRGAHTSLSMKDLLSRAGSGTLVASTDDPNGAGPSWQYRLSGSRLDIVSPTQDDMTLH